MTVPSCLIPSAARGPAGLVATGRNRHLQEPYRLEVVPGEPAYCDIGDREAAVKIGTCVVKKA